MTHSDFLRLLQQSFHRRLYVIESEQAPSIPAFY